VRYSVRPLVGPVFVERCGRQRTCNFRVRMMEIVEKWLSYVGTMRSFSIYRAIQTYDALMSKYPDSSRCRGVSPSRDGR
jgi:hypothetical protein